MLKKTIQINPELFNIGNKKKKRDKKKKKLNPFSSALKPNDIKKQLIQRVKDHHKKKKEELQLEKEREQQEKTFTNDFNETFSYLEKITNENKKKKEKRKREKRKKRNKTIRHHESKPDPPYGCLKNASKPTFREYNKTIKKKELYSPDEKINIIDNEKTDSSNSIRQNKLEQLKDKFNEVVATIDENVDETKKQDTKEKKPLKKRRRMKKYKTKKIKRKLTLGKNLKQRTVGVLINNKTTRKKIKNDHNKLHTKSTNSIKKYLLKHNLMKIGSTCPEEILRVTYENSYLTGDVINKNPEILLHNYMQES